MSDPSPGCRELVSYRDERDYFHLPHSIASLLLS